MGQKVDLTFGETDFTKVYNTDYEAGNKGDKQRNASSESDYLWTSVVGKHNPITPRSFCTGYIIIDRQPSIEKVFYKLSQLLRSR